MDLSINTSAAPAASTPASASPISATLVAEGQRLNFLPKHFGPHYLVGETAVYNAMKQLCASYNGGFWDFIELSNGGFYMRLSPPGEASKPMSISVEVGNGYSGEMSADAASIVATLFALNGLAFQGYEDLSDKYYLLLDFAAFHAERREIFQAID
jgi:Antirestriction protein